MKVLKVIVLVVVGLVVAIAVAGFLLPSRWRVERSIVVNAPTTTVYPLVASFKTGWTQWSPFGPAEDPTAKMSFNGPELGSGATQNWTSERVGTGSMVITKADPAKGVEYTLEMTDPVFRLTGSMTLEPTGAQTKVTWVDEGDVGGNPFKHLMAAAMGKMMGPQFEKGLAALKQKAEAPPKPSP